MDGTGGMYGRKEICTVLDEKPEKKETIWKTQV
jgi:hypothetical protein